MAVLYLIFLATFVVPNLSTGEYDCKVKRCSDRGPDIRFPFRLKGLQPEHCGYPGFELSCTQNNETKLELSFPVTSLNGTRLFLSVNFLVQKIDYTSQLLRLSNLEYVCLPEAPKLQLSGFPYPFYGEFFEDYTFLKCPSERFSSSLIPFPCLSNSRYQVYAVYSARPLYYSELISCSKMFDISMPLMYESEIHYRPWMSWSNPNCQYCEASEPEASEPDGGPPKKLKVAGMVLGPPIFLLIAIGLYKIYQSKKQKKEDQLKIEEFLEDYKALKPTRYSYADIKKITANFGEKLGQGGYGTVYKGNLSDEVSVAVKVLNNTKGDGEDFVNEVGIIGRVHHINVVRLVGYCADGFRRVLVYEFLPNLSLEKFISSENKKNMLGWEKLHQIALGIAKGVEYLHQGCDQRILHFDIKPHNILLDHNYNPKVADFGQAKLCSKEQSVVSMTAARGTIGYIAPEVFSRNFGNVSCKSDIYSFGMLLLEIVGRRKNIIDAAEDAADEGSQIYFPEWMYNKLDQGEEVAIEIEKEDDNKIARKLAIVGLWCIQWYPADRPSMKVVIQMLEAEDTPSMPQNPFGSANKIKNKAVMRGSLFSSELKSIAESE